MKLVKYALLGKLPLYFTVSTKEGVCDVFKVNNNLLFVPHPYSGKNFNFSVKLRHRIFGQSNFNNQGVHEGLNIITNSLCNEILKHLSERDFNCTVYFVGMSLGGSIAALMCYKIGNLFKNKPYLFTFGSFRVGNGNFNRKLLEIANSASRNYCIYIDSNNYDPVCFFPKHLKPLPFSNTLEEPDFEVPTFIFSLLQDVHKGTSTERLFNKYHDLHLYIDLFLKS